MKIVSQTQDEIIIASPKVTGTQKFLAFSIPLAVVVIVPLVYFLTQIAQIGVTRISCIRVEPKQVDCQISQSKYLDMTQQKSSDYKFVKIAKFIEVESRSSEGRTSYRYNFSLITKFGEKIPFESTTEDTARKVVETINSFLISQQDSFSYAADDRFSLVGFTAYILAPILAFLGLVLPARLIWMMFLIELSCEEIILNKLQSRFQYTEEELTKKWIKQFTFTDVAKVDVVYSTDSYDNVSFVPRITLHSGKQFCLDKIGDRYAAIALSNNLNQFMGLPEEEDPVVKK